MKRTKPHIFATLIKQNHDAIEPFLARADVGRVLTSLDEANSRLGHRWIAFLSLCAYVFLVTMGERQRRFQQDVYSDVRNQAAAMTQERRDASSRTLEANKLAHASAKVEAERLAERLELLISMQPWTDADIERFSRTLAAGDDARAERRRPLKKAASEASDTVAAVLKEWDKWRGTGRDLRIALQPNEALSKRLAEAQKRNVAAQRALLDLTPVPQPAATFGRASLDDQILTNQAALERAGYRREQLRMRVEETEAKHAEHSREVARIRELGIAAAQSPPALTFPVLGVQLSLPVFLVTWCLAALVGFGMLAAAYNACVRETLQLTSLAWALSLDVEALHAFEGAVMGLASKTGLVIKLGLPALAAIVTSLATLTLPESSAFLTISWGVPILAVTTLVYAGLKQATEVRAALAEHQA